MIAKSKHASRVTSLALQDITFSACGNTMNHMKKETGVLPILSKEVGTLKAGVARIMELQE